MEELVALESGTRTTSGMFSPSKWLKILAKLTALFACYPDVLRGHAAAPDDELICADCVDSFDSCVPPRPGTNYHPAARRARFFGE